MRFNSDRPIFAQIAEFLEARVLEGALGPGERLPSARELAFSLEVNPNTAARALQALADGGVARCERGTGYFVSETGPALAKAERRKTFFETELPALFRRMGELGIGIDEVAESYASRGGAKGESR
jgi:DNA-binding transcriptional regulator YhcF (GntR family)